MVADPPARQEQTAWLFEAGVFPSNGNETEVAALEAHEARHPQKKSWVLYKQCGESWSNDRIGESSTTICAVGCAMSSVAMALASRGAHYNPGTLNKWLIGHNGYEDGDDLVWGSVTPIGVMAFYNYYHGAGSLSPASLDGIVAKGWPVVVNVRGGTHWVLVTGKAGGGNYRVNDPGFPTTAYAYSDMLNFVVYS